MKAPKILPWIARKTGISDELALNLWRRAASEAEELAGNSNRDNYFQLAVEPFINLCQDEGEELDGLAHCSNRLRRLTRYQDRIAQVNLLAARKAWQLWIAQWGSLLSRKSEVSRVA